MNWLRFSQILTHLHYRHSRMRRQQKYLLRQELISCAINIKDLGYRWGSCGRASTLNFHWRVIQLPPGIIDYVVVHELVHLHEPRHNADFWRRVEQALPDFTTRKQWLTENGCQF